MDVEPHGMSDGSEAERRQSEALKPHILPHRLWASNRVYLSLILETTSKKGLTVVLEYLMILSAKSPYSRPASSSSQLS